MSKEQISSPTVLEMQALSAAKRAGHAAAMVTNLSAAGNSKRAEIWEAEQVAWTERQISTIAAIPLGKKAVAQQAMRMERSEYQSSLVVKAVH